MKRNQQMTIFLILLIGSSQQIKISQEPSPKNSLDSAESSDSQNQDDHFEKGNNLEVSESSDNQSTLDSVSEVDSSHKENLHEGTHEQINSQWKPLIPMTSIYNRETQWNDYGNGSINYLDRHNVDCNENNSALHSYVYEHRDETRQKRILFKKHSFTVTNLRYSYTCVKSPEISDKCQTFKTTAQDANFIVEKSLNSLVKHNVSCPQNSVMKRFKLRHQGRFDTGFGVVFRLDPKDRPQLFYEYTCCEANISRIIYAQTPPSYGGDNEYYNLRNQFIDAKDLNAISSFSMQLSKTDIYYSMRFSTLNGQISPSYPDPCGESSQKSNPAFLGN